MHGLDLTAAEFVGNEDGLSILKLDGLVLNDLTESLTEVKLEGVPFGYTVYYDGVEVTTKVLSGELNSGTAEAKYLYSYTIAVASADDLAKLAIKAPSEHFSGTLEGVQLKLKVNEGGESKYITKDDIAVKFNPQADGVEINATQTFGKAYDWLDLKINANMLDTDGSETLTLKIQAASGGTALTDAMLFRLADGTPVTALFSEGVYTLTGIPFEQINKVQLLYTEYNGVLSVQAQTVDTATGLPTATSDWTTASTFNLKTDAVFGLSVTGSTATLSGVQSDYAIDFKGKGVAGPVTITLAGKGYVLTGIDTLKFGSETFTLEELLNKTVNDNNQLFSGVIIDGVIEGLSYETSSGLKGYTDANGSYQYHKGDSVTFSVGGVILGTQSSAALADGMLFLQDLAGVERTDLNNDYVQKMAVFLQSLDGFGTTADGIQISEASRATLSDVTLNLVTASMADVVATLTTAGYTTVSVAEAMAHVREMLVFFDDSLSDSDFDATSFAVSPVVLSAVFAQFDEQQSAEEAGDVLEGGLLDTDALIIEPSVFNKSPIDNEIPVSDNLVATDTDNNVEELPPLDQVFAAAESEFIFADDAEHELGNMPVATVLAEVYFEHQPLIEPATDEPTDF